MLADVCLVKHILIANVVLLLEHVADLLEPVFAKRSEQRDLFDELNALVCAVFHNLIVDTEEFISGQIGQMGVFCASH